MRSAWVLPLLLVAPSAMAQRTLLYDNPAPLVTSSRLVGMGGATVGLAENSESMPFNYAAVAQRSPHRARGFDFDLTAAVLFSPVSSMRDIDNETSTPHVIAPVETQFGGMIQFKRFGIGGYARLSRRDICLVDSCDASTRLSATTAQGAVVFGFNILQDQLVFGLGLFIATATFDLPSNMPSSFGYTGFNVGGGTLVRPHFFPMRFGVSAVTQTTGTPGFDTTTAPMIAGKALPTGIVSPARISVGVSARLGEGAWRYNRLSMSALKEQPDDFNAATVPHDLEPDDPRPPGRFLLSAQLDVIFPVSGATTLNQFIANADPLGAGESLTLVPRLGAEVEVVDHILRLRGGTYLEPPVLKGTSSRGHGTFGFEVFLLHLLFDWSISASADLAPRFFSLAFGLGWWS